MFSIMEYFGSKLPFFRLIVIKIPCMPFSVDVVHNNCIIEGESYSFVFKNFGKDFFAFESFLNSFRRYSFNRSFCVGGSVSANFLGVFELFPI